MGVSLKNLAYFSFQPIDMKPDYEGVFYTWLFFFAVIGIMLVPAFQLKRIAKRNGRKGWVFFLVGIAVGIGIIFFNRVISHFIYPLEILQQVRNYLWIPYLIVAYGLVFVATSLIANKITKREQEKTEEVLDSDFLER